MMPLTHEKNEFYKNQKNCYICKKRFITDDDNEDYHKVRDHCQYAVKYSGATHCICNLRQKTPKKKKFLLFFIVVLDTIIIS